MKADENKENETHSQTSLIDFYCFKSTHACVRKLLLLLFVSIAILRAGIQSSLE